MLTYFQHRRSFLVRTQFYPQRKVPSPVVPPGPRSPRPATGTILPGEGGGRLMVTPRPLFPSLEPPSASSEGRNGPQSFLRYADEVLQSCGRNPVVLPEICGRNPFVLPQMCRSRWSFLRYADEGQQSCLRYVEEIPQAFLRYSDEIPLSCPRYAEEILSSFHRNA